MIKYIFCKSIHESAGFITSTLLTFIALLTNQVAMAEKTRCEPVTLELCKNIGYNMTIFPNIIDHSTQAEAGLELIQYTTLVSINCSPYLKAFLCSTYVPMCSDYNQPFPPCRHMCEQAKNGCESLMNNLGIKWAEKLRCDKFPVRVPGELCFGPEVSTGAIESCQYNAEFTCPSHMRVPSDPNFDYEFMGSGDCGASCEDSKLMFWNEDERNFARIWTGCWSFVCLISTLFTVLTYLIDMKRFLYPERPIVFLSDCAGFIKPSLVTASYLIWLAAVLETDGCYMMVSIAYVVGFLMKDAISCKEFNDHKVVIQGTRDASCTVLFMMVYFFSMASSIWWVMLTVTWFLAAGLKWSNEAIEQRSPYFHAIAWIVPAIQTMIALLCFKVEGDVFGGVCYVGLYNTTHLLWSLLVPLSVCLLVGTGFLVAGLVAMINIRNVVKHESGTSKVEKLEKLMVRIGIFSVLYTVPATVTIACYFYELLNKESWQRGWLARNCRNYGVPCPCEYNKDVLSKPDFVIFIAKYFMTLIVGITSGFWIWSSKTVESWSYFKDRLFCLNSVSKKNYRRGEIKSSQHTSLIVKDSRIHRPV